MHTGPREISVPYRPIPLEVPKGMKANEFFNSTENLNDLVHNNGLLQNSENLLYYRKALGHSNVFDASIIYNTSQVILDPLGRPVRRTQVPDNVRSVWNRMNQVLMGYMQDNFPDPEAQLILCGEASLDATWPMTSPGVPSIRMLHNHFIAFDKQQLANASLADPNCPNLTDGGQHSLFESHMHEVYHAFFETMDLSLLRQTSGKVSQIKLTGYPQGLPCWEILGGMETINSVQFWREYDVILKGFIDFYRSFFSQVSTRNAPIPDNIYFPEQVTEKLLFNNEFLGAAKIVRDQCIKNASYANLIRWQPAFKQLIYRNDAGKWIVTISQNSIGNAITELLGVVVKRVPDAVAYKQTEHSLVEHLLAARQRLITADLGEAIKTQYW
ncbi:MAG: hypothetical protein GY896_14840 [Gammaproteobacteria bacterium]|nr:hypothetical protein [Gammaproteobacteria bacterium]